MLEKSDQICGRTAGFFTKTMLQAHSAFSIQRFLIEKNISILQHPPYSPDLAPRDFFLFPKIKSLLKGTHFQTVDDVKMKTAELLKGLTESDWQHYIVFKNGSDVCNSVLMLREGTLKVTIIKL